MQLMLQAHDTLFRVWELAVSFLGLPPLPLVPREKHESQANFPTGERSMENVCTRGNEKLTAFLELESAIRDGCEFFLTTEQDFLQTRGR